MRRANARTGSLEYSLWLLGGWRCQWRTRVQRCSARSSNSLFSSHRAHTGPPIDRHKTAQNETAQYGTKRHKTARHKTEPHKTAQNGTAQNGTKRHNTERHKTAQYGTKRNGTKRPAGSASSREYCCDMAIRKSVSFTQCQLGIALHVLQVQIRCQVRRLTDRVPVRQARADRGVALCNRLSGWQSPTALHLPLVHRHCRYALCLPSAL